MATLQTQIRKPALSGSGRDLPDLPRFPVELTIDSRRKYDEQMQDFWYKVTQYIQALEEDIARK